MAGSLSDYAETKVLEDIVGKTSWTMPTFYLAASTTDPLDSGSGITEPTAMGYARVATAGSDWGNAPSGSITNAAEITFPTATGTWGTISHGGGFDALAGGNFLCYADYDTARAIASGDTLVFPIGSITLTMA